MTTTQNNSISRQLTKGVCNEGDDDAGVLPSEFDIGMENPSIVFDRHLTIDHYPSQNFLNSKPKK